MKIKFQKKAFTLIEMLIVIVIIGVLAASLIPRLTSVRDRANDVARRADLNQVATAIIARSMDNAGDLPVPGDPANEYSGVILTWSGISDALKSAGMDGIPQDPNVSNEFNGLDRDANSTGSKGQYGYIRVKRNGVSNKAFVLMAKTETPGASNRLHLGGNTFEDGFIQNGEDSSRIIPCKKMTKLLGSGVLLPGGECIYSGLDQLRYLMVR